MKRVILCTILTSAMSMLSFAQTPITTTFYFPQIADGAQAGTIWKSALFITNPAISGTSVSNVTITFTRSDGSAFNIEILDESGQPAGSGNSLSFQLARAQTRKFTSRGNQPLSVGYATVTASQPVIGTAVFSQSGSSGQLLAEAAVPSSVPQARQAIFVDTVANYRMGVAYANPGSATAAVSLQLVGSDGVAIGSPVTRTLLGGAHSVVFVHELFPDANPLIGTLQITSSQPLAVMALRFDPSFSQFTTFLPVTIARLFGPILPLLQESIAVASHRMLS